MSELPAIFERPDLAAPEPQRSAALDAEYREIVIARPYPGPVDRPRSVVLLATLVALAICGAPCAVFLLAEVVAR